MKNKTKHTGGKAIGNRTIIGIVCIVIALAICFGIAPLVNRISEGKGKIVRVTNQVMQGCLIREEDVEVVDVGKYNLPADVLTDKAEVVGKYATVDLYAGDYLLPQKLTSDANSATDILGGLDGSHKAMSVTISSFASGVSGKLETGDIISVIVYSSQDGFAFTPSELQYVKVITSTTSTGIDKADVTDSTQPVTVTLLVNQAQAELLAQYENAATMHFTLEYRGDPATAQRYLEVQNQVFAGGE